jgi:HAD superfamily hydrolase (TIGR01549 family)
MAVSVVFFDVGETLIDESRLWNRWAAYLGVSADLFRSALDEIVERGEHHRKVFERFKPGLDLEAARRERAARDDFDVFDVTDAYPDAVACLTSLRQLGYTIGIAGNQPRSAEQALAAISDVDLIASSASLGVEKPNPEFFAMLTELAKVPSSSIAYVGDRLDNDVLPARQAGMVAVHIERGPWGRAHAKRPEIALAHLRIGSLTELPAALAKFAEVGGLPAFPPAET